MNRVYIHSVSVLGPGLPDWDQGVAILQGLQECEITELQLTAPASLPANERRRASRLSKMAIRVAEQAMAASGLASMDQATVFASSCGDMDIVDKICRALTMQDRPVSPTQFHNSVHNAQAGYWAIANQVHKASNSISAYTGSFAAGLLEAATVVNVERLPVLLVAYDRPAPGVLSLSAPSRYEFAAAFVLGPQQTDYSLASAQLSLQATFEQGRHPTGCHSTVLEDLRTACPAACALPLMECLARKVSTQIVLPYLSALDVVIDVDYCNDPG